MGIPVLSLHAYLLNVLICHHWLAPSFLVFIHIWNIPLSFSSPGQTISFLRALSHMMLKFLSCFCGSSLDCLYNVHVSLVRMGTKPRILVVARTQRWLMVGLLSTKNIQVLWKAAFQSVFPVKQCFLSKVQAI